MADVCADEYHLQTLSAMAAAGIEPLVTCTTVLTTRSMETTERYSLPGNIGSVLNGECVSLEPVFSAGIYRPIPAGSRVTEINATATSLGSSIPYPLGKNVALTPVLKADPYSVAYDPARDVTISAASINSDRVVVVTKVSFSLVQNAPLTLEGTPVSTSSRIHEYIPLYGANKAPCYLPVDMYPALRFTSDSGPLPRDLVLEIDITYESPRTMESYEPAF